MNTNAGRPSLKGRLGRRSAAMVDPLPTVAQRGEASAGPVPPTGADAEQRAELALDYIISRSGEKGVTTDPRISSAFRALASAMNEIYGPLPPSPQLDIDA